MAEAASLTDRVLDALKGAGLLTAEQASGVHDAAEKQGVSAGTILSDRGLVTAADLAQVLEGEMGIPQVDLSSYAPEEDALALVPADVARDNRLLPLFEIEGMLTLAVGDPFDVFLLDDVSAEIGVEVEPVLADAADVRATVVQYYGGEVAAPVAEPAPAPEPEPEPVPEPEPAAVEPVETPEIVPPAEDFEFDAADLFEAPVEEVPAPPTEAPEPEKKPSAPEQPSIAEVVETAAADDVPKVDLEVLAIADAGKVAVLVTEILEKAVRRGANRIHLLPYKDDFFLVYRTRGKLEKVGAAPMAMQAPLVEGFKAYARLQSVPNTLPALGRMKTKVADRELVLTVSSVPTVAGQRLVVQLAPVKPSPRSLLELGMTEAEGRALQAMVERGRGMLLVCAPVAGGRSTTYYSLLDHAAHVGKTVYSVESTIEYEIPAVAQVMVNPGSPVSASAYFAAGMRQDTDVIALDAVETVEDVHLAIEAAGLGKLVIATFAAGDIVTGVRRMLDLGAEPNLLAAALTLGVGQRLARTNCPECSQEVKSAVADKIPGAAKGMKTKAGAGCEKCGRSGFLGATGIYEVLPFSEAVRSRIAKDGTADELSATAKKAGMRPLSASGLAKVQEGLVSAEELNRVLRFAE